MRKGMLGDLVDDDRRREGRAATGRCRKAGFVSPIRRRHLHLALDDFGSSLLTDRETQVINLVLHGHSTKSIAARLKISVETVKLHRKHAYAKLEINSQAELFYLFLDSLMSARDYQGGDTLVSYLAKPV